MALICPEFAHRMPPRRMKRQPNPCHSPIFNRVPSVACHVGACVAGGEAVHIHSLPFWPVAHFTSHNTHVGIHCHLWDAVAGWPTSSWPSSWPLPCLLLFQKRLYKFIHHCFCDSISVCKLLTVMVPEWLTNRITSNESNSYTSHWN